MPKIIKNLLSVRMQNEFGFGTGAKSQPKDSRDHVFSIGAGPVDWQKGFDIEEYLSTVWAKQFKIPISNQNGSSSCVSQAWGKYASIKNYVEKGTWTEVSKRDIYAYIRLPGGGAYGRDGGMRLVNNGSSTENDVSSYENGQPPSEAFMATKPKEVGPLLKIRERLKLKEIKTIVNIQDIDEVARTISINHGCVFAVKGTNNGTWMSQCPKIGQWNWSHYLYAGKFRLFSGVRYIGVANSWGTACGDQGWQWLSEDWFAANLVYDGWTATDQKNHVDREADFEKFSAVMWLPGLPEPSQVPYSDINWNFLQHKVGIYDITAGMHYDYEMAKKMFAQYNI